MVTAATHGFCQKRGARDGIAQQSNAFVKYEPVHSHPSPLMRMDRGRLMNAMEDIDEHTRKISYVLIVDSDPTIRRNLSEYFSDHNMPTISAPSWSELNIKRTQSARSQSAVVPALKAAQDR
jgi:hypothetical protein